MHAHMAAVRSKPGAAILQQVETDSASSYSRDDIDAVNVNTPYPVASAKQLAVLKQTALIANSTS